MDENNNEKPWWVPVVHFAVHAIQGSLIFAILAAVSFGVGTLSHFFVKLGASHFTEIIFDFLEHSMLVLDAVVFLRYLVVSARKAYQGL